MELDNTLLQDQVMEERGECEVTDGSGVSYEESCKLGGGRLNTSGVAVDVSDSVLNKEACNTEEASTFSESRSLRHRFSQLLLGPAPRSFWGSGSCYSAFWLLLQCHFQEEPELA